MRLEEETYSRARNSDYWSWMKVAEMEDCERLGFEAQSLNEYTSQRVHNSQYAPKSLDWDSIPLPGETPPVKESDDDDLGIGGLLFTNKEEDK